MAEKYFGPEWEQQQVIGEQISLDEHPVLQITGVSEDVPANTHFNYHFLISGSSTEEWEYPYWFSGAYYHYFRLHADTDMDALVAQLDERGPDYIKGDLKHFLNMSYDDFAAQEGSHFRFFYQPISDIHLDSHYELELANNGNRSTVSIFSLVSVLVLLMAAINFMNLSTVSGLKRHKEVGVRKVLGSSKGQVVFQFLLESVMITLLALGAAVTLIQLGAPIINQAFGLKVIPPFNQLIDTLLAIFAVAIGLGLLSGLYPSLMLSSLSIGLALKGFKGQKKGVGFFKNGLIVFQFGISLIMIIGMSGIYLQLNHLKSQDLGYDKDQVMIVEDVTQLGDQAATFRQILAQSPLISSASLSGFVPIGSNEYGVMGLDELEDESDETLRLYTAYVDEHYIPTYGLELVQGRQFSKEFGNEADKLIVNEAFAKARGVEPNAMIGKRFRNAGDKTVYTVIGVIKDFQTFSMDTRPEPFALACFPDNQAVSLRFEGADFLETRAKVEEIWSGLTDKPFAYSMANSRFETIFSQEEKASRLFSFFALLAVVIGGLGLLGVASYVIVQRTKEVGIRKVLGATFIQLFITLSRPFMVLVGIAGLMAIPTGFYLLDRWVGQYAYQMGLSWWLFALPFLLVAVLALLIVGTQIKKVVHIGPVKSLRYE